jgi:hypothetical protein
VTEEVRGLWKRETLQGGGRERVAQIVEPDRLTIVTVETYCIARSSDGAECVASRLWSPPRRHEYERLRARAIRASFRLTRAMLAKLSD